MRALSSLDQLLSHSDRILRSLSGNTQGHERASPAEQCEQHSNLSSTDLDPTNLSPLEQRKVGALMRINHTGEVCAQALYHGQSLFAHSETTKHSMEEAAKEEIDHLVWCEQRLKQLDDRASYLNPLWYGLSFSMGAIAGAIGDKWSLGFVEETEHQVCKHLEHHLEQIPSKDQASRAILTQMIKDEAKHAEQAHNAGASELAQPIKKTMGLMSKLMTKTTYYI